MKSCYECIHCNEYEDRCEIVDEWIFYCDPENCSDRQEIDEESKR